MATIPSLLEEQIEILGQDEFVNVPILMSDILYYNEYPYKIEFINQNFENRRSIRNFRRELEDFADDFNIISFRFYLNKKKQRVYLKNKKDLTIFMNMFHSIVKQIHGPVSQEHLALLCDPSVDIDLSEKYYYNKYDCKVMCIRKQRYERSLGYWRPSFSFRSSEMSSEIEDILNFSSTNLEEYRFASSSPYRTNFFCMYNEFVDLLPFLTVQQSEINYKITKRLLLDK